jgi:FkbM family methyltransferase
MNEDIKYFIRMVYEIIPFKRILYLLLRNFFTPNKPLINHLYFGGKFKAKLNGYTFYLKNYNKRGYTIENLLFWNYKRNKNFNWEKQSISLWETCVKNSTVIFDIGANTGIYSIFGQTINPKARIIGFEPMPHIFQRYKTNCLLNNYSIHCFNLALSNEIKECNFYAEPTTKKNIYSGSLSKDFAASHSSKNVVPIKIKTTTLFEVITQQNLKQVDLMKIDVEGFEYEVLIGMGTYLKEFKPSMLVEVLTSELGNKLTELLKPIGYLFFSLNKNEKPELLDNIRISQDFNYFFCTENRAVELNLL